WTPYLEIPDVSVLAERLPSVPEEAARLRSLVEGYEGTPLARGQLLYPGRQLRLTRWPRPDAPLVQLEGGSAATNALLADQCVLSPGPIWVFRIRDELRANEVRGKFLRPGEHYILLAREALAELPSWIAPTNGSSMQGAHAYSANAPLVFNTADETSLEALGLGAVTDVLIRPAALPPASWDGEGAADWLAGEQPILAISSSRAVAKGIITLNGVPHLIPWPASEREVFLELSDLDVGSHQVGVSLFSDVINRPVAAGSLQIVIRSPPVRLPAGSFGEGLMIMASPAHPTLSELWDGRAVLEVRGPQGVEIELEAALADGSSRSVRHRTNARLPIEATQWGRHTSELHEDEDLLSFYDSAESCIITVRHPRLGAVTLRAEREFAPLRWIAGRRGGAPQLRLLNNSESAATVSIFEFAHPDRQIPVELNEVSEITWPAGGLVVAEAGTASASNVLPPRIRHPTDLESLNVRGLTPGPRTSGEVRRLLGISASWATASLPADPFAATGSLHVQQAIAGHIAALIGGGRWAALERRASDFDELRYSEVQHAVGDLRQHHVLAASLLRDVEAMLALTPQQRSMRLMRLLDTHTPNAGHGRGRFPLAQFALQLASDPASLAATSESELDLALQLLLVSTIVIRVARLLVLEVHALIEHDTGGIYRGWSWG
ncbi:hypothetical protein, partial [Filomicrobium sp.]|uniref:hypothetical protein n=1 Tax=Filomicrobium sp. TaxID=2024831 RepID=UPI002588FC7B